MVFGFFPASSLSERHDLFPFILMTWWKITKITQLNAKKVNSFNLLKHYWLKIWDTKEDQLKDGAFFCVTSTFGGFILTRFQRHDSQILFICYRLLVVLVLIPNLFSSTFPVCFFVRWYKVSSLLNICAAVKWAILIVNKCIIPRQNYQIKSLHFLSILLTM